ncbi:MAG TPA: ABC transporter substrate-binding protein [Candidatus Binatia bacterium]|nr:ABC transporter substrate-binding protein [Candidatus Binatia bacterium]
MFKAIVVALVAATLWTGCSKGKDSSGSPNRPKVTLQLNWKPEPQFGGFYAAEVEGIYARHGLDVTITPGGAGSPTVDMIGAGTVPFAIVSADEIVRARSVGNSVVALFAVYQTNPQGIMTRASRGFKTLADVFTHPGILAMERGLPYSDFLQQKYGFGKLKIVPSPFGDLTLYRTEKDYAMQCFVTSEPLAAKKTGIEPQTFLIAESGYNPYTTVVATSESYLKSNPEIVESMIDAVREGWQAYLKDPAKANEYMGRLNPTMDAQTFKESAAAQKPLIESADTERLGLGAMTLDRWRTLVEQLLELKVVDKPVEAQACFTELSKTK